MTEDTGPPGPRAAERGPPPADTRARILAAARELFAERGYHATPVREIADRLGLTKTAVLYHFPSKQEIVAALAEPMLADLEEALAVASAAPLGQRRWAVVAGVLDAWLAHRHLLQLSQPDLALAVPADQYRRLREALGRAVDLVAGPGADPPDRVRAVQAVGMLSDPVVFFPELPAEVLRPAVLAGVERLLAPVAAARPDDPGHRR